MTELSDLELSVLEQIRPKPEEYRLINEVYSYVKDVIESHFRRIGVEVEASLQGSVAHDTWLSGDRDIDVFILFPKDTPIEKLKGEYFREIVEISKKLGSVELRYAEHPYVKVYVKGVDVELVPAYKLDSPKEIRTAVDRTPFHTKFVNSKLTSELRDHVRLLKQFMKTIGVYGAEVKVRGFSGYVAELLVIVYGGFRKVLEATSKWRPPVYINSLGVSDREFRSVVNKLRKKYPDSIIYLPDPVDWERNTAANVSRESLSKFVVAAQCYLNKPSTVFFEKKTRNVSYEELLSMLDNRCLLVVELDITEKLPPDVLWGELRRVADRAFKVLRNHDFHAIDYSIWSDEETIAYIVFELEVCVKNYPKLYVGPAFWKKERVIDYIGKHLLRDSIGPWISKDGELLALGKRKYIDAKDVLVDRAWEYLVAPHFRGVKPRVYYVKEVLKELFGKNGVRDWIVTAILKREPWIESCIQ